MQQTGKADFTEKITFGVKASVSKELSIGGKSVSPLSLRMFRRECSTSKLRPIASIPAVRRRFALAVYRTQPD